MLSKRKRKLILICFTGGVFDDCSLFSRQTKIRLSPGDVWYLAAEKCGSPHEVRAICDGVEYTALTSCGLPQLSDPSNLRNYRFLAKQKGALLAKCSDPFPRRVREGNYQLR